jgi:sialate O-acetylesterase
MKTRQYAYCVLLLAAAMFGTSARAEDLRKIVSLSGTWRFSIGDDTQWASPAYDDSGWDQISVPDKWEDQGYNEYNGYAWYRKTFRISEIPSNVTIYLMLGRIDDADVVYLNGKVLGRSGKFPPNFETAYGKTRKYAIPAGYLKENAENLVAVKVYDTYLEGGIIGGPTGIYIDADIEYLSVNLNGRWKFHTGDNKEWKAPDFNDEAWKRIQVPSEWENEGYFDYDGYAWYRVKFRLPQNFRNGEYFLSLGKIDDIDDVYMNGRPIGSVYDLRRSGRFMGSGWEYTVRRLYKIPDDLLIQNGINTLAVRVYDGQGVGGIYEGPVGIMSAENYKRYRNKHHSNETFWDYVYDFFYDE